MIQNTFGTGRKKQAKMGDTLILGHFHTVVFSYIKLYSTEAKDHYVQKSELKHRKR
jgi:hypothetical protein